MPLIYRHVIYCTTCLALIMVTSATQKELHAINLLILLGLIHIQAQRPIRSQSATSPPKLMVLTTYNIENFVSAIHLFLDECMDFKCSKIGL